MSSSPDPQRILVVQPSWVGDAVMATPTLRALRERFPQAHISYLMRRYVKAMYTGMPWADRLLTYRTGKTTKSGRARAMKLGLRLREGKFDLAVLLPNSFQSALICKVAGIKRVVGYDRDGRGFLLSDKLLPVKRGGKFVPLPIVKYYMGLAQYLGSTDRDLTMRLFVTDAERREAEEILTRAGIVTDPDKSPAGLRDGALVMLNPGAQYGSAKCWPPEYFAELSDKLVSERGATVLISSAPKERKIAEAIFGRLQQPAIDLGKLGPSLGALKEIVRRCDVMVTNDTGPRHIAAALGVPVLTIFGPTFPQWTEISFARERQISVPVFCGPCQLKVCPLDHRCMRRITPEMAYESAARL